jgi:hypothetical protein
MRCAYHLFLSRIARGGASKLGWNAAPLVAMISHFPLEMITVRVEPDWFTA